MSDWFDILYRKEEPSSASARPELAAQPDPIAESPEAPSDEDIALKPTEPLTGLPARWALEVQKIAFHLKPMGEAPPHRCLMFSSIQKRCGTTTICYLVAHHFASERGDQRVLHVDFSADRRRQAMPGTEAILTIGQTLSADLFANIDRTFTRVAIRPGESHTVAGASGWIRDFMAQARRHCDWIFVDAPPFFAAPETYGVAKACDGVVLVLKSGESRYPALNALVSDLDALGIKTVGTVLNFRQYPIPRWLLKYI
jgi:hypothetical protein